VGRQRAHQRETGDSAELTDVVSSGRGLVASPRRAPTVIRRYSGPTPTSVPGEYRVWLSDPPSAEFRRRFLGMAEASAARPLRPALDRTAAAFTFVTSGDLRADLLTIDRLLKEANEGIVVADTGVVTAVTTWQQQHARMMRAYQRATSAAAVTVQVEDDLCSFFVWCFHLKDWLKNDPTLPAAVKAAAAVLVNTNESLKLCAELANGVTQLRSSRRERADADGEATREEDAPPPGGRVVVVGGGRSLDARDVAGRCTAAWAAFLREHRLL
jgi:hypothetical protein